MAQHGEAAMFSSEWPSRVSLTLLFPASIVQRFGRTGCRLEIQGTMRLPRPPRVAPYAASAPPRIRADNPGRLPGLSVVIPVSETLRRHLFIRRAAAALHSETTLPRLSLPGPLCRLVVCSEISGLV